MEVGESDSQNYKIQMSSFQQQQHHKAYRETEKYDPFKETKQTDRKYTWRGQDIGVTEQNLKQLPKELKNKAKTEKQCIKKIRILIKRQVL